MIIVDKALEARRTGGTRPIGVGIIGAGFMARGVILQIEATMRGKIHVVGIANRTVDSATAAFEDCGVTEVIRCDDKAAVARALASGMRFVTDDAVLLAGADGVDVVVEITGTVEQALPAVLEAIANRKHVVLMNAELDATLGPLLKARADEAGVIYTNVDGDQPGVIMNLYRFVQGIGVRPVLCGNIKGLHDPYRTPATQAAFAARWKQRPSMVTSFADGTKISFEQALVANATGMSVAKRGMHGFAVEPGTRIEEAAALFPLEDLLEGPGIVDYVVGAHPAPGVFVLGAVDDPVQRHYLEVYKMGAGPIYCFYVPYHLCHLEVPSTIARAALFGDAVIAPRGAPVVEVVATAKRDLKVGETLDELGGYMMYGLAENAGATMRDRLLPIGVAPGCSLLRDVPRDAVITYDDVAVPSGRLTDRLREEQIRMFHRVQRSDAAVG